ncbi:DUF1015 domain-containing protein [Sediminispirochaeta smaragdinae]|uniref:DUF1015 domain-containing protein n=1 Tax=Sediminispirochaeta smaragdinae (strain DSM 11293 / JCM 15392 / SEBR 4228) TaxID=573413 RepID=E1R1C4_SEDSS|nr:DUF1015 domain-containing protein [Sediminispirochaeta smaragdinae]ADK81065.1 conserved hypothetical protein [Sediminispirochaeta smaragdinae DSM 11293]
MAFKDKLAAVGVAAPAIVMPNSDIDMSKWAVVACDQYTSEPEYWEDVAHITDTVPSTFKLIFPECYLEDNDAQERIKNIQNAMKAYLADGVLTEHEPSFFLVKRETGTSPRRWGLMVALDLEAYDYSKDSTTLIRATEGTIIERIPPRKKIRIGAPLELPHIMVLIDDPDKTVIEPLTAQLDRLQKIYDFDLMKEGGHLTGYKIDQSRMESIADALTKLADPKSFEKRYGSKDVLLFAMGDGNHSLATAKAVWEEIKANKTSDSDIMNHPARWALVEVENIYDEGLIFEPIHRVLFDIDTKEFLKTFSSVGAVNFKKLDSVDAIMESIKTKDEIQRIGYVDEEQIGVIEVQDSNSTIAAGTVQAVMDSYLSAHKESSVDYIHGEDVTIKLGRKPGNCGILLPALDKGDFFKTVILDGALPRKTFSMGEAHEKRFYVEARKITR